MCRPAKQAHAHPRATQFPSLTAAPSKHGGAFGCSAPAGTPLHADSQAMDARNAAAHHQCQHPRPTGSAAARKYTDLVLYTTHPCTLTAQRVRCEEEYTRRSRAPCSALQGL